MTEWSEDPSRDALSEVVDRAPVAMTVVDAAGECSWCNARWLEVTGCARDAVRGHAFWDAFTPEWRARLELTLGNALRSREPFQLSHALRGPGQERWMLTRGVILEGEPSRMLLASVDVTELRERTMLMQFQARLGDALSSSIQLDEMLERVARLVVSELADLCTVAVVAADGRIRRVACASTDADIEQQLRDDEHSPLVDESSALVTAIRSATSVYRPLVDAPGPDEPWELALERDRSLVVVPLHGRHDVVGALAGVSWQRRYAPADVLRFEQIADRCAMSVEHALLLRRSEEARARLALLATVGEQLATTLDPDATLRTIVRLVVPVFADVALVALVDGTDAPFVADLSHVDPDAEAYFRARLGGDRIDPRGASPIARAIRTQRPVLIENVPVPAPDDAYRMTSLLAVPLQAGAGELGALLFGFTDTERSYSAADLPLALDLARRSGLAIERARAYDRERGVAETLQHSLLPEALPEVPGLSLCARYLPGGPAVVGGDWYDVVPLSEGRYGLVIGDVAGHGVRAATVMGQLRQALRVFASEGYDAAAVVQRLNRFVFDTGPFDLATVCYAVLDPAQGHLEVASAGHPPPLLMRPDGSVSFVELRTAPPIGADPDSQCTSIDLTLAPGTTVLLYTDGLIERRGESLDRGLARLAEMARFAPPYLEETCDLLTERLVDLRGPGDDVAILGLRFVGPSAGSFELHRPAHASELGPMRRQLGAWFEARGVTSAEIGGIMVAVSEAATNAIEHAYSARDGWFEVEATADDEAISITVRDGGQWRPKARGGGGRGLGLIGRLMDEFQLRRRDDGTEVWMRVTRQGTTHGLPLV